MIIALLEAYAVSTAAAAEDGSLPTDIKRQLPSGYTTLMVKSGDLTGDGIADYAIALARPADAAYASAGEDAGVTRPEPTKRPLMLFTGKRNGHFALAGRNDDVVAGLSASWQCDPFLSSSNGLTLKGRFFTVENEADCGTHWSDYVTFRYDLKRATFLFSSEIYQDWTWNPKAATDENASALVRDRDTVTRADPRYPITFSHYSSK